ncbi:MAG: hypothetical protein ABIQ52_03035 [Vicinamibacterales bacterium]
MRTLARLGFATLAGCASMTAGVAAAQNAPAAPSPMLMAPALPPATMMEAFQYPVGTLFTVGYDDLGEVAGISVEVREMRDARGRRVRGVVVEVTSGQTGREQALIDAEEIPDLLKGFDAMLEIRANPTQFRNFETRYATKGELILSANSSRNRGVLYAVEAGRLGKARRGGLTGGEMHQLRVLLEAASQKLATLVAEK